MKASESLTGHMEGIFLPKSVSRDGWKRLLLQMQRQQCKPSRNVKNEGKLTPPKDHNNLPVINLRHMEICNLPNKEFKTTILRKFNELQ